jgi:hypothetical protein
MTDTSHEDTHACTKQSSVGHRLFAGSLFGLIFDPEDGGYISLRDVEMFPNYMAL